MLAKINRVMRKIGTPINILNIIVGILIGIAHVYLPFTSLFGLVLGILMALSGSVSMAISYYFTSKNSQRHNAPTNQEERPPLKNTRASNVFLGVAVPMLLLNTAGSFFGMYTGTLLLIAALALPIAPPVSIAIAVGLSIVLAAGTFINSWLQTHYIWETLKQPAVPAAVAPQAPQLTCRDAATQTEACEMKPTPRVTPAPEDAAVRTLQPHPTRAPSPDLFKKGRLARLARASAPEEVELSIVSRQVNRVRM